MKTSLDCFPCFFQQALRASRMVSADEETTRKILKEACRTLGTLSLEVSPPEIGGMIYSIVSEATGIEDPFADIKKRCIQDSLKLYPELKKRVKEASDPLETAVKVAVAGNVIDFGTGLDVNLNQDVEKILEQKFTISDLEELRERLRSAVSILYLADNAGETVFDRVLIEQIGKRVLYAVREKPVINDAVREDAVASGLGEVSEIISSGSRIPGTLLSACSAEFVRLFRKADLIISKGQGNYECLSDEKGPVFFLLKAKCPVTSDHLDVEQGSILLLKNKKFNP